MLEPSTGAWSVISGTVYDNRQSVEEIDDEHVWHIISEAAAAGEVLCCATNDINSDGQSQAIGGVMENHAYSIVHAQETEQGRVVYVRNP
jgi:hypothetical protein